MRSVVICGSRRYKQEMREFASELKEKGVTVFEPFLTNFSADDFDQSVIELIATGLTFHHVELIRKADACFIFNKGNYVGKSTCFEMGVATALGKPIYSLSKELDDFAMNVVSDKTAKTPEELVKLLQ